MDTRTTTPEEEYARIWQRYTKSDEISPELVRKFSNKVKLEFLKLAAIPSMIPYMERVRTAAQQILATAQKHKMFDMRVEGADVLANADLILGNHQGPTGEGAAQGGIETILGCALLPDKTITVLKSELVEPSWKLKDIVRAHALRKGNPIAVHRPDQETMTNREYAEALLQEIQRVSDEVFRTINQDSKPVMMYPEGTRSPDGKILPFLTTFFHAALEQYVLPRIQERREINIGVVVADTLQVFRDGFGGGAPMYNKRLTLRGVKYPTDTLRAEIDRCGEPIYNIALRTRKRLGKFFARDAQAFIQQELVAILRES